MRSFRDMNPYLVGLVSVLVIGALTGAAFGVGLFHLLEHTYDVHVEFSDASGLKTGDSVRVAGVKVGRVTDIKADRQNGLVLVDLVVNTNVHLSTDATADIALETLLGAKYVRLKSPLPLKKPYLDELPNSDPRRKIPVSRTTTPFDVFKLTRIGTENIKQLDTEELNTFINDLAGVTEGKQQSVADLVTGLDKVSTAINQRNAELGQLLDRADALSQTLADKDTTLVALIDESKKILDLLAGRRDELATALGQGSDAVVQLARIIGVHQQELDRILSTLHPTLEVVANNQEHIDVALAWLGPGFYQQSLAGRHGPWLDLFIRSLGPDVVQTMCEALGLPSPTSGQCGP
ncbi:MAG: phospholipid/cholesterol/gamma-HCH transport system substrate-binding protein [Acidimicrobiaceae bacterium]|jgi:phospholipid/cholesterol/gamma-HCH transport system substrate-binding protein